MTDKNIQNIQNIINYAIKHNTSDIHLEPKANNIFQIRLRTDGILQELKTIPNTCYQQLSNTLKIMAKLDISEKRLPQDGRLEYLYKNSNLSYNNQLNKIHIRVSTCPTIFGEKIVLRILNNSHLSLSLQEHGLSHKQINILTQLINKPQGLILVTGPTGSGKTQLLYTILNQLNQAEKNIITIEDPIEVTINNITQIQVHPKIGLSFAHTLRTIMRQDPDVIMIGEIRDKDTAQVAIKAAETGHLVLATLHTTATAQSINRLIDMGVSRHILAECLLLSISSRLVRKLNNSNQDKSKYQGRTGIYELMPIDTKIRQLIHIKATSDQIYQQAITNGMEVFKQTAKSLIIQNITNQSEISRVLI